MSLFKMAGKYMAAKAKGIVKDIWEELDLDKDGIKDRVQIERWCDTLGHSIGRIDDAIDQAVVMEVVKDVAGTVREISTYIEGVKANSKEEE